MIDISQNRNGKNIRCVWWTRREDESDLPDELIMSRIPDGSFYAEEVSPEMMSDEIISNSFRFDKTSLTLKSTDYLGDIKNDDLVDIDGEKWFVVNVQRTIAKKTNTLFAKNKNYSRKWYIELRK